MTSAPYDDPLEGGQVLHFTVPFSAEGVSLADDWHTMGMRATGSQTVLLERVFVPEEAVVLRRPRGQWHTAWNVILTVALPIIMSVYVGVAEQAAEIARAQEVKRMGDSAVAYLLGELTNLLTTARLALADMVRSANEFDFQPTVETADLVLVRKTIVSSGWNGCFVMRTALSSTRCRRSANTSSPAVSPSAWTRSAAALRKRCVRPAPSDPSA